MQTLTWEEFEQVHLVAGTVMRVEEFPAARKPAYRIWADFGPALGILPSSAQITALYSPEELIGRQIIGVVNFPAKNIAGFQSRFLVTGFPLEGGEVVLAQPERTVPNGSRLA